jgi:uncharacterized protein (TIGR02271 family)
VIESEKAGFAAAEAVVGGTGDRTAEEIGRVALAEERLLVGKREVERGRVVVRTRVEEREEIAEAALRSDAVSVERVPVNREVEAAPPVREEDGVTIIPVLEEQMVVLTRLVLKEEIRITRTSRTELFREPVRLRSERAEVVRLEGSDDDLPTRSEGEDVR